MPSPAQTLPSSKQLMSSLLLFMILLFSLSIEACNARSLRFDVRNPIMPPHDLSKVGTCNIFMNVVQR